MSQAGGPSEAVQQDLRKASNSTNQAPQGSLDSIAFVKEQQGTQGVGGGTIGQGVGAKTIQDTINEGKLVTAAMGGMDPSALKSLQTKDVRGIQDANYQTVPSLKHTVTSQGQGQ